MKRRLLIPEVAQTSAMDCGPACLKAVFGGFNTYLSYGRLREACQTDVDGTSIDTLEDIANRLGMSATQSMLAPDQLLLEGGSCLPAIVVTKLANGATHFIVLWRVLGRWVQIMDPAAGRVWQNREEFLASLHVHEQVVPSEAWREWCATDAFAAALTERAKTLNASTEPWADGALQDAALRLGGKLHQEGHLRIGEVPDFLALCAENPGQIPAEYWMARPDPDDQECVLLRGAVLLTVSGPSAAESHREPLPESLARVRGEPEPQVWRAAWTALIKDGWTLPIGTALALCTAALGTVLEALLFRGLVDVGRYLESSAARFVALAALMNFLIILLLLDWSASKGLMLLGRRLELHLRVRFLSKIPTLGDRYLQSRLLSDMAYRAHSLHVLRQLPETIGYCLQLFAGMAVTGAAIVWVYDLSWVVICAGVGLACLLPLLSLPAVSARDLRLRELSAALSSLYLDTLLGSRTIQAHGAQPSLLKKQGDQLTQLTRAGRRQLALLVRVDTVETLLTVSFVVVLIFQQSSAVRNPAGLLLLVYWALSLTQLSSALFGSIMHLPRMRNLLLRFLEPLGAPDEGSSRITVASSTAGLGIEFKQASIVVAGRTVLEAIDLKICAGEHVAIVGVSGAGKSSLLGCLLGWYQPAAGSLCVDGALLDGARMTQLRHETAWIDPQVHLFRGTLFDNLRYGNESTAPANVGRAVATIEMGRILKYLPKGLQTALGEGGTMLSGGEGQRVRMARALGRPAVRLALLDEAARGLGREDRRQLLAAARAQFSHATMLCVTHDVSDTRSFDRVLVIEHGRIVEDGAPLDLEQRLHSRFRALLEAESTLERQLWTAPSWRRIRMTDGTLQEGRASQVV